MNRFENKTLNKFVGAGCVVGAELLAPSASSGGSTTFHSPGNNCIINYKVKIFYASMI